MSDYDGAWKEALEQFFEAFVEFFFPQAHADIDWSRGIEFLDTELQQIQRDAEQGLRIVDKLVRVWRRDGHDDWVLTHIEIQGDRTHDFEARMFACHYRIFDKYQRRVATLVVLADENSVWRPCAYGYELWGCRIRFEFPTAKLLDLAMDWERLESHPNPFSLLVMAYLKAKELRNDPESRFSWKVRFIRSLYERGWSRQMVLDVFHTIDWFLELPPNLELRFRGELETIEAEKHMPYVTSIERIAKQEGRVEGRAEAQHDLIRDALEDKFGSESYDLVEQIAAITDSETLRTIFRMVLKANSSDEVRVQLK